MNYLLRLTPLLVSLALAACGGGSTTTAEPSPVGSTELTIQRNVENGTVTASNNSIDCGVSCSGTYAEGSQVTLVAKPAEGYKFVGWNAPVGCTDAGDCTVDLKTATTVSATFTQTLAAATYGLDLALAGPAGAGSVTIDPSGVNCTTGTCHATLTAGATASLTAVPAAGYTFTGWSVSGISCTGTTCAVPMSTDRAVTATFAANKYTLYASVGTGTGRITSSPKAIDCPGDCNDTWPQGSKFTLVATPAAGQTFVSWSGACTGTSSSCVATINGLTNVVANFGPASSAVVSKVTLTAVAVGKGRVKSAASGIDCGTDCYETVPTGTSFGLTATPDAGNRFVSWSGACTGSSPTCNLTLSAHASAVAQFAPVTYSMAVAKVGSGNVTGTGIACGADCSEAYAAGTAVVLTAKPSSGYVFAGWSGACSGTGTCSVTMNANSSVSAKFTAKPPQWLLLSVTRVGSGLVVSSGGSINCGTVCTSYGALNTPVTLSATPAAGNTFTGWTGACTGTGTCSVVLTGSRYVTATFAPSVVTPTNQTLSVTRLGSGTIGSGSGAIACGSTCSATVATGTVVQLNAVAASGHSFSGWSGACSGTQACSVTMNAPRTVNASFTADAVVTPPPPATYGLTITRSGSGTVSSTPAGIACGSTCTASFSAGSVLTLNATPSSGYTFAGWSGAGCSGTAACTVTMNAASTVFATFAPVIVSGTKYIPLTLAAGPAADKAPLRTGVPFPVGALSDISRLRLETSDGSQEVPAQFDAISRWPDGSIKVALTHLVADLGAARSYRVAYGSGVVRAALPRNVAIGGSPSTEVTVDTGSVKFAVSNKGVISKLWRDVNANGTFEAGEQIIDSGDMFMVNAYDNLEYTASASTDTVVTVEESGPMRAVIKAQGSLTNASGAKLIKYMVRYYANQGSDKVDMDVSVIDDRLEANVETAPTSFAIAGKALGMRWHYLSDGAADYRFGGEGGVAYGAKVSGEHYILQKGVFTYENGTDMGHTFAYSGVGTGSKAAGWVALDSGSRHLALMVKDFWQQFPGELSVNGNTLTASLFPARGSTSETTQPVLSGTSYKRAGSMYFTRPGGAKTYQMRFAFGAGTPATATVNGLNDSFQRHRLELMAAPAWYASSGVFGDLNVGTSSTATTGYDAYLMKDIYERSVEQTEGNATMYGWRDYGDRLRAGWTVVKNGVRVPSFYNDSHVGANNFFTEFLRTGDQRWFGIADIATRHFMDIDVSHGPRAGYWVTGGQPQPAGEVHAISHENLDHQVRNLHWGHAHVSGMSNNYLLTGDKRSFDVLSEVANWWKFVSPHLFKLPFTMGGRYREAERDFGWPLYVMNEYVRVTSDAAYHKDVAGHHVNYLNDWFRTPANHIGFNPATGLSSNTVIGVNDASKGTGYWTMTKMDNGNGFLATGTNPWMAGAFMSNIIKFYEADKQFAAVGKASGVNRAQVVDMLLQGMNYIVKYGYDSSRQYFVYSEVIRNYGGGDNHLIYPLAYLDRLYKQELAAGRLANPGWYDTQATWGTIATRRYDELRNMKVGANTQSYGFYGYEIIYPADYFKVMQDTLGR